MWWCTCIRLVGEFHVGWEGRLAMVVRRVSASLQQYCRLARGASLDTGCGSCSGDGDDGLVHVKQKLLAHAAVGGAAVMMVRAHGSNTLASHAITACVEWFSSERQSLFAFSWLSLVPRRAIWGAFTLASQTIYPGLIALGVPKHRKSIAHSVVSAPWPRS